MIGMANGLLDCNIEVGVEKRVGTITINGVTYDRYVKIIDCGALPNSTSITIPNSTISGLVGIINLQGIAYGTNGFFSVPRTNPNNNLNSISLDYYNNLIRVVTAADWSTYNLLVTLEYYK